MKCKGSISMALSLNLIRSRVNRNIFYRSSSNKSNLQANRRSNDFANVMTRRRNRRPNRWRCKCARRCNGTRLKRSILFRSTRRLKARFVTRNGGRGRGGCQLCQAQCNCVRLPCRCTCGRCANRYTRHGLASARFPRPRSRRCDRRGNGFKTFPRLIRGPFRGRII